MTSSRETHVQGKLKSNFVKSSFQLFKLRVKHFYKGEGNRRWSYYFIHFYFLRINLSWTMISLFWFVCCFELLVDWCGNFGLLLRIPYTRVKVRMQHNIIFSNLLQLRLVFYHHKFVYALLTSMLAHSMMELFFV